MTPSSTPPVPIPGPIIGTTVFSVKVACSGAATFTVFEVQSRDLCDPINHTFATYAKVPDSLLYTAGAGSSIIPWPGSWIFVVGSTVYLQLICGWTQTSLSGYSGSANRFVPNPIRLYQLVSIDPITKMGAWTLVSTNSTPGVQPAFIFNAGGAYVPFLETTADYPVSWTYGDLDGSRNTTTWSWSDYNGTHTDNDTQTINATTMLLPFSPGGGGGKINFTEIYNARKLIATGWYVTSHVRPFGGSLSDNFGNNALITESVYDAEWNWPSQPILNGQIFDPLTVPCMPVAVNNLGSSALYWGNLYTFSNYNNYAPSGGLSTQLGFQMPGGVVTYTGPVTRNSNTEVLSGLWGLAGQATVWTKHHMPWASQTLGSMGYADLKALGTLYTYADHYVVHASDSSFAHEYPIYSYLDEVSGGIVWIKGVEDPYPQIWRDQALLFTLDGRPANGQLWPRTRLGVCPYRPPDNQLWPRTR